MEIEEQRPILILSTAHRQGTGAFVMLSEFLLQEAQGKAQQWQVVTPRESLVGDTLVENGQSAVWLHTKRDNFFGNIYALFRARSQIQFPKMVVAWHSRGFEMAWLLGRLYRIPTVGILHDHPVCRVHGHLRRVLIRFFARRLDHLVAVSEAVAAEWHGQVCSSKITVIRNGLGDLPGLQCQPGPPKMPICVGFLGMYNPCKGFEIIQDWMRETRDLEINWRLYGDVSPSLREEVSKLKDLLGEGRVITPGFRKPAEIFGEIDVLVHASTAFDPFPTVLLEAARAGVPAIASSLGGSVEIVDSGNTGYVFDPEIPGNGLAALRELATSPDLVLEMGLASRKRFDKHFRIRRMYEEYLRCWDELSGVVESDSEDA